MPRLTIDMGKLWQRVNTLFSGVHAFEDGLHDIEVAAVEIAFARRLLKTYDETGAAQREDVKRIVAELDKLLDAEESRVAAKMREGAS